jgi:putative ABC transport system substrate-binding protein
MRPAAQRLGIELITFHMLMPSDAEAMISDAQHQRADAVWAYGGGDLGGPQFARLVSAAGLPLMSVARLQTEAGGLLSYGPDFPDLYRRAAVMADRLLKGASPAEMPVEQPTKFELVINLKSAQRLGVTIPRSVLLRADEVIQ